MLSLLNGLFLLTITRKVEQRFQVKSSSILMQYDICTLLHERGKLKKENIKKHKKPLPFLTPGYQHQNTEEINYDQITTKIS